MNPRNLFQLGKLLNFREKVFASAVVIVVIATFVFWVSYLFLNLTKAVPQKGGEYTEGIIGQPMYINPLLSQTSEADSDLAQIIFSGLLKYDGQGKLTPDMAESYELSDDQKVYTFHIKKNIKWHDGEPLTAEDIFFTIHAVQDPMYKSLLRLNWQGVEIEQKDKFTITFNLKNPYSGFLDNLTIGIIPKHIWENVAPEKFSLAEYNLKPVGSGPYQFVDFQKDSGGNILSYSLKSFKDYFDTQSFVSTFNFNFYPDDGAMLAAYNKKEITGMGSIPSEDIENIKSPKSTNIYELSIPRYFAVFLNQTKSVPLASDAVRKALAYATDRQEIIDKVLHGKGISMFSPFLPQMAEYENSTPKYDFNTQKAEEVLEENGWKYDEKEKVRKKSKDRLEIEIFTTDWPELAQTADVLLNQWGKIGVDVKISVLSISDLQQNYIRPREYGSLLFGQAISFNPDLYSFWHSSQKRDPGLNLALFDDKKADELLDSTRQEIDENKRIEAYRQLQKIMADEVPAIFLYSPSFLYPVNQKVKGIEVKNVNSASARFTDVNKWYIKTKRVKK